MIDKDIFNLTGKRILVTGGAGGIGFALASQLANRGARIIIADISGPKAEDASKRLSGNDHSWFRLDITSEIEIQKFFSNQESHIDTVDIVLNCAGIAVFSPALDLAYGDFSKTMEINLNGAFLISKEFSKVKIRQQEPGRIIHLASVSSYVSNLNYAAYASSKAGLYQLVRVLGREWAPHNITVNAIGPAITPTAMTEGIFSDKNWQTKSLEQIPMGRFGTPEDLIGTVILLASEAGRFITGQTIFVDGGRTLV